MTRISRRGSYVRELRFNTHAYVLFMDVVGYSTKTDLEQRRVVLKLQEIVSGSGGYRDAKRTRKVIALPVGDAVALVFFDNISSCLSCATDVASEIARKCNFSVRMGMNSGPVCRFRDMNGKWNVSGLGINMAQRVMDCGDAGHILLTSIMADTAWARGQDWRRGIQKDVWEFCVKHGETIRARNFVMDQAGNPRKPTRLNRDNLERCGIVQVYPDRLEPSRTLIRSEILDAIRTANKRIWISGIALSERTIPMQDLLTAIKMRRTRRKIDGEFVRILLQDPYRTAAVYRALLETEPSDIHVFRHALELGQVESKILDMKLFQDCEYSLSEMSHTEHQKNGQIRYYRQGALCWLVIVDDRAWYQPYTFGRKLGAPSGCIGPYMPVFELRDPSSAEQLERYQTFSILLDHFDKLWKTSDVDLFHLMARRRTKHQIIREVAAQRGPWFKNVLSVLDNRHERRKHPRRPCEVPEGGVSVTVRRRSQGRPMVARKVVDASYSGLCVELPAAAALQEGAVVSVGLEPAGGGEYGTAAAMFDNWQERFGSQFRVVSSLLHGSVRRVGLEGTSPASHPQAAAT